MPLRRLALAALVAATAATAACQEGRHEEASGRTDRAAPPAPARAETRKFREWLAVCDNGDACAAFAPAAEGLTGWLRLSRDPGPADRPVIMAGLAAAPDKGDEAPLTLTIDGRVFPTAPVAASDDQIQVGAIRQNTLAVADALGSGRRLTLSRGEQTVPISLSGAAAALLWIDERQGRLATTTALAQRGRKPPAAALSAPPLPAVAPAAAVSQARLPRPALPAAFEARPDVRQCRSDTRFSPPFQSSVTVDRLSPDVELWGVPCFAGAYNFSFRYFITGPGGADPRPVAFPTSRAPTDEVVNGRYDPASRTLSAFDKGRGLGDCGVASTWVWAGRAFVLKAEREMRECWGVPADLWPTTWRTR